MLLRRWGEKNIVESEQSGNGTANDEKHTMMGKKYTKAEIPQRVSGRNVEISEKKTQHYAPP